MVSNSTILPKGFVEINLRLYYSSDSTIFLFYDSSVRLDTIFLFYDCIVSNSTILRNGFVEINLRLYYSSDSTIFLFYDSSFRFYDFSLKTFKKSISDSTILPILRFSYSTIVVSNSTILRNGFVEINLRLYYSSDSTIFLFYDSSFQFYDFSLKTL